MLNVRLLLLTRDTEVDIDKEIFYTTHSVTIFCSIFGLGVRASEVYFTSVEWCGVCAHLSS